jgi:hypothetical protein
MSRKRQDPSWTVEPSIVSVVICLVQTYKNVCKRIKGSVQYGLFVKGGVVPVLN